MLFGGASLRLNLEYRSSLFPHTRGLSVFVSIYRIIQLAGRANKGQFQGTIRSDAQAVQAFLRLFQSQGLFSSTSDPNICTTQTSQHEDLHDLVVRFKDRGGSINWYGPGQLIKAQGWHSRT